MLVYIKTLTRGIRMKANYYFLIPVILCSILFFIIPKHSEPEITLSSFYDSNHQALFYDFCLTVSIIAWIIFMVLFVNSIGTKKDVIEG